MRYEPGTGQLFALRALTDADQAALQKWCPASAAGRPLPGRSRRGRQGVRFPRPADDLHYAAGQERGIGQGGPRAGPAQRPRVDVERVQQARRSRLRRRAGRAAEPDPDRPRAGATTGNRDRQRYCGPPPIPPPVGARNGATACDGTDALASTASARKPLGNKAECDAVQGNATTSGNAPGRIRTCDRRIRNPVLYPAELRAHQDNRRL